MRTGKHFETCSVGACYVGDARPDGCRQGRGAGDPGLQPSTPIASCVSPAAAKAAQTKLEQEFSKREQGVAGHGGAAEDHVGRNGQERRRHGACRPCLQATRFVAARPGLPAQTARISRRPEHSAATKSLLPCWTGPTRSSSRLPRRSTTTLIVQEAVYVSPRIDITDQVLKALAANQASLSANPASSSN